MFGFGKKAMAARLESLVDIAQMIVYVKLKNFFRDRGEKDNIGVKAAVWVNYLFGKSPMPQHKYMNLSEEHSSARAWLTEDDLVRELVVQSLRVVNIAAHAKKDDTLYGEEILFTYGAQFSRPDIDGYRALVHKVFESLPAQDQQSLSRRPTSTS